MARSLVSYLSILVYINEKFNKELIFVRQINFYFFRINYLKIYKKNEKHKLLNFQRFQFYLISNYVLIIKQCTKL